MLSIHRAADALHRAADDLAFDQHRIDHHAAIMGDGVVLDVYASDFDIHLDNGGMRRIRPRHRRRLEIERLLEPGIDAGRPPAVPARARRLRDLAE